MKNLENIELVVLAAGLSSRNFPHSKGPHKCLLPFGSEKIIDRIVREPVEAGIKHITFVVSSEVSKGFFEACFARMPDIEAKFAEKGDHVAVELLKRTYIPDDVSVKYVIAEPKGLAYAIGLAAGKAEGRHVAVCYPDDMILPRTPGTKPFIYKFLEHYATVMGGKGNLAATRLIDDPKRWGVVEDGYVREKQPLATSRQASCAYIIFDDRIATGLNQVALRTDIEGTPEYNQYKHQGKEIHYSDYFNETAARDPSMAMQIFEIGSEYRYLDCGTRNGYEEALVFALLKESVSAEANRGIAMQVMEEIATNNSNRFPAEELKNNIRG